MFSFFKRRPLANNDDISLDVDDTVELPQAWRDQFPQEVVSQSLATPNNPAQEEPEVATEEARIAMTAAQRAVEDNAEEIRRGQPYTAEERQILLHATGSKYVYEALALKGMAALVHDLNDAISNQIDGLDEGLQEISDKLDEPRDGVGRAIKFQQEHPFLAGLLGADIAHRLGKK